MTSCCRRLTQPMWTTKTAFPAIRHDILEFSVSDGLSPGIEPVDDRDCSASRGARDTSSGGLVDVARWIE